MAVNTKEAGKLYAVPASFIYPFYTFNLSSAREAR
jgi:hypothetical protein